MRRRGGGEHAEHYNVSDAYRGFPGTRVELALDFVRMIFLCFLLVYALCFVCTSGLTSVERGGVCSEKVRGRLLVPSFGCLGYVLDTWCLFNTLCLVSSGSLVTLSLHERGGVSESVSGVT